MSALELPIVTQSNLLCVNRTSLYYKPRPISEEDLKIKKRIDFWYTKHPELGYRRITKWMNRYDKIIINHKAVLRHMREMGIQAVYPKPNISKRDNGHQIYPYLLRDLPITHPDHVWSIDITYIPIRTSWLYLVAIIDWYSRYVIDWMLDDSLEIDFVLETSKRSLTRGKPNIMNCDQGSHFTSPKFTELFLEKGCKISMDGRGRAHDNIFIERLWRTVKYENVYPQEYDSPIDARRGLRKYLTYYNKERLHQSLSYCTPEAIYLRQAAPNIKEHHEDV